RLAALGLYFLVQGFPHHTLSGELVDDGLLLLGIRPAAQEVIQRGKLLFHAGAGVVAQRFGDQLAVRAVVLHTLGNDVDRHVVDHVLDALFALFALVGFVALGQPIATVDDAFLVRQGAVRRHGRVIAFGAVDHHGFAI